MYENFIRPLEYAATAVLDVFAEFWGKQKTELSDPPTDGCVTLPQDLFSKPGAKTEWWYYTGHCVGASGRQFGFQLVFFKHRTDHDRIGIVPIMAVANPMYFAHFAILDIDARAFRYEHLRSFDMPFNLPVAMSETACDVSLGPWSMREIAGKHTLHATFNDGTVFDAVLDPVKTLVLNGDGGITRRNEGASNHFSYTRMSVVGQTAVGGEIENFTGSAWMDREFGNWEERNWNWFSIQLDDGTELMIYQFYLSAGEPDDCSTGTFVDLEGRSKYLGSEDFEINELATWISEKTGAEYPSRWQIVVPILGIDIEIEPFIADQELDTRGTTMIVYWEGACKVTGTSGGDPVTGRAFVELVGYDRSHETVGVTDLIFGGTMRQLREIFA